MFLEMADLDSGVTIAEPGNVVVLSARRKQCIDPFSMTSGNTEGGQKVSITGDKHDRIVVSKNGILHDGDGQVHICLFFLIALKFLATACPTLQRLAFESTKDGRHTRILDGRHEPTMQTDLGGVGMVCICGVVIDRGPWGAGTR